ncbi:hypothetical protein [Sphingomonas sp. ACRSK]|uniref:hypothetical protein n=1 Tax=Sphingomonas sp. ACRSK TaxID=2918213 RepID=UPI001EF59BF5|nr:hypothetical protein [Sphingomonas sp. ACRSK]MCG7350016.1 hypothetical protein [Sphingomonas sp. ACRSK]
MPDLEPLAADAVAKIAAGEHAAARADAAERVKIQASLADGALKALLLVNGGAMVALFTFIGNLLARADAKPLFDASKLWLAFACFVVGLGVALICHVLAFASQDRFYRQSMMEAWRLQEAAARQLSTAPGEAELRTYRQGGLLYLAGVALSVVSILAFVLGCGFALAGVLLR